MAVFWTAAGLLFASGAQAAWSDDNTVNTPVVNETGDQRGYRVLAYGSYYYVVWHDNRAFGVTGSDIYAQSFDSSGNARWGAGGKAVCEAEGNQTSPRLVPDGAGGIIVAWDDGRIDDGANDAIYAQRIDMDGKPQWDDDGNAVIARAGVDEALAGIVPDYDFGAIVASDKGAVTRIDEDAVFQWGDKAADQPVIFSVGAVSQAALATDLAGGAFVTWIENQDVFMRRISGAGEPSWDALDLSDSNNTSLPRIVPDGDGGAVVVWLHAEGGGIYTIRTRRVTSNGVPIWGVVTVNAPDSIDAGSHSIVPDGFGGAIVTWFSSGDLDARRFNANGSLAWDTEPLTNTGDLAALSDTPVVVDGFGGFIIAWLNTGGDIVAQRVNGDGSAAWIDDGVIVSRGTNAAAPVPAWIGRGNTAIVFGDDRAGGIGDDIYLQGVASDGSLGDPAGGTGTPAIPPQSSSGGGRCFIAAVTR